MKAMMNVSAVGIAKRPTPSIKGVASCKERHGTPTPGLSEFLPQKTEPTYVLASNKPNEKLNATVFILISF